MMRKKLHILSNSAKFSAYNFFGHTGLPLALIVWGLWPP